MLPRLTGALAVFAVSFAIFLLFELLAEALDDGLAGSVPTALALVDAFAPIGLLQILLPISIGGLYWLWCPPRRDLHVVIWHAILFVAAYFVISIGLLSAGQFIYLNGSRNLTLTRIIGNTVLCAIIATGIISAWRRRLKKN